MDAKSFRKRLKAAQQRVAAMDKSDGNSMVVARGVQEAVSVAGLALLAGLQNEESDAGFDALVMLQQVEDHFGTTSDEKQKLFDERVAAAKVRVAQMDAVDGSSMDETHISSALWTVILALMNGLCWGFEKDAFDAYVMLHQLHKRLRDRDTMLSATHNGTKAGNN